MPPHCDALDGPVVTMARKALDAGDVKLILPYVPKEGEGEVIQAFDQVLPLHQQPNGAREVADRFFFETVVRIHRAGEGAPFTGLKPAGLDVGPVIPVAEQAIAAGAPDELIAVLTALVQKEVAERFAHMQHLRQHAEHSVDAARAYVQAMLGLQVWAHSLYLAVHAQAHEGHHAHG